MFDCTGSGYQQYGTHVPPSSQKRTHKHIIVHWSSSQTRSKPAECCIPAIAKAKPSNRSHVTDRRVSHFIFRFLRCSKRQSEYSNLLLSLVFAVFSVLGCKNCFCGLIPNNNLVSLNKKILCHHLIELIEWNTLKYYMNKHLQDFVIIFTLQNYYPTYIKREMNNENKLHFVMFLHEIQYHNQYFKLDFNSSEKQKIF